MRLNRLHASSATLIAVVSLYFTVAFNIAFYKKVVELNGGGRLVRVLAAGAALLPAQWRLPAAGCAPAAQGDHPGAAGDRGRDFLPVTVLQHLLRQAHAHQCADHRLGGKQSPDDAGVPGVDRGSGCRAGVVVPHGEGGLPSLVQGDRAAGCPDRAVRPGDWGGWPGSSIRITPRSSETTGT